MRHFQGEVDGETVGIVQFEGLITGKHLLGLGAVGGAQVLHCFIEKLGARLQRLQKRLFLVDGHAQDALAVIRNLGIGRGHGVHDGIHEALHGGALGAEQLC